MRFWIVQTCMPVEPCLGNGGHLVTECTYLPTLASQLAPLSSGTLQQDRPHSSGLSLSPGSRAVQAENAASASSELHVPAEIPMPHQAG